MKNYTVKVNGNVYKVTVEEGTTNGVVQKAAPAPAASGNQGGTPVTASVPGKVVKVDAAVGAQVKAGDAIVTLEAMKMEIPVVAPKDGKVVSIEVAVGAAVENGDLLATMD